MKPKIKTIAILFAILSVLQVNAQEARTFLPIFSDTETTIRCYVVSPNFHPRYFGHKIVKYPYLERTYKVVNHCNYWGCFDVGPNTLFVSFTVSDDNSKLWGNAVNSLGDTVSLLIMDLNLNIGDTFEDMFWSGTQYDRGPFTVVDIYELYGRKHIEFDFGFPGVNRLPLIFIEGIGPTFYPTDLNLWGVFRAKYIGDSMEYCVLSLLSGAPIFSIICDCFARPTTVENTTIDNAIGLYPQPVGAELSLQIPEGIDVQDAQIRIYDVNGNLQLHTNFPESGRSLNVSNLTPGVFLLRIIGSNINETAQFIKL